ncbi:MAG: cation:proton antiporter subunit C [Bacteroidales bacterium]|nr:cation:proton antiporter subunit C [Bacteroidales bacterium]MDZ4203782.1 cation:proton antiporter subunit C [Bacteroidales bacterium]
MTLFVLCFILFLVGMYGVITRRNMIKIILGLCIMEYSLNLFFVLIGYVKNGVAPIITKGTEQATFVDPLPQAMVLTVIVIGLATTAMLMAIAIRLYRKHNTFDIREINTLKG